MKPALGLLCLLFVSGQEDAKLASLLDQLAEESLETRERAAEALVAIGAPALPALRAHKSADADVSARVAALIRTIERNELLAKVLGRPTLVTIRATAAPLSQVLADLSRASGTPIVAKGLESEKVTLNLKDASFWRALDAVCRAHGNVMYEISDTEVRVTSRPYVELPKVFQGRLLLLLPELRFDTTWYPGRNQYRSTNVAAQLAWEKGTAPSKTQLQLDQFRDDKGTSLLEPKNAGVGVLVSSMGQEEPELKPDVISRPITQYSRTPPDKDATAIASLKGCVMASFVLAEMSVVFEGGKPGTTRSGTLQVSLRSFKQGKKAAVCRLVVEGDGRSAPPEIGPWQVRLIDSANVEIRGRSDSQGMYYIRNEENRRQVIAVFDVAEGTTIKELRLVLPSDVHAERIPFQFENLPIR